MSESDRRTVSSGQGAPPPRRAGSSSPAPPVRAPKAARAEPAPEPQRVVVDAPAKGGGSEAQAPQRAGTERNRLPLLVRVLAWLVAIPLGLALVGIPARRAGYLSGQKLLDVVIGRNVDRFVPLVVIVVLWALVTALLVQVFAEGGAWLMRRRRARKARRADA